MFLQGGFAAYFLIYHPLNVTHSHTLTNTFTAGSFDLWAALQELLRIVGGGV